MKDLIYIVVLYTKFFKCIVCRCVICRAKILRLKQHHKKSFGSLKKHNNGDISRLSPAELGNSENELDSVNGSMLETSKSTDDNEGVEEHHLYAHSMGFLASRLPNSASNYSINNSRLSASSSNQSFASGSVKN